jgi:hypothetical protein
LYWGLREMQLQLQNVDNVPGTLPSSARGNTGTSEKVI